MPRIQTSTDSQALPFVSDGAKQRLVCQLLGTPKLGPVLALEALDNLTTRVSHLDAQGAVGAERDEGEVFEGHMLAAMEHLAGTTLPQTHPTVFVDVFDGLSSKDRAGQTQSWNSRHDISHWPAIDREIAWGPLLASIAALDMGATCAIIHLSCPHLMAREFLAARRYLLEQNLIAGVAFTQLPLSTTAGERDCYLKVARRSDVVRFYEIPRLPRASSEQPIHHIATVHSRDLLLSPDAGLSLFDAKVMREKRSGKQTLGDIAQVLSSAGSAIRRSGGLSDDETLPVRYISIVDFDHGVLKPKGTYFQPEASFDLEKYQLKSGDILIARNATAGNIQFVAFDAAVHAKPLVASENVLVLRVKDSQLHPYALYIYLAFGGGSAFLTDCRAGATLASLSPRRLLEIPAPVVTETSARAVRRLYGDYIGTLSSYEELLLDFEDHEDDARRIAQAIDLNSELLPPSAK